MGAVVLGGVSANDMTLTEGIVRRQSQLLTTLHLTAVVTEKCPALMSMRPSKP